MRSVGTKPQLRMMGIDLEDYEIPDKLALSETKLLRIFAQGVPPVMAEEIALATHNGWTDYGRHGGMPLFKGDGSASDNVLEDVCMVKISQVWRACRIVSEDTENNEIEVCLRDNMELEVFPADQVHPLS